MKKKLLLLILCFLIILPSFNVVFADAFPSKWAETEVNDAIVLNLVPIDLQTEYTKSISREDFCKLVVNFVAVYLNKPISKVINDNGIVVDKNTFTDTQNDIILYANSLGIVTGKGNKIFDPNGSITRQEAATMLGRTANFIGIDTNSTLENTFADKNLLSSWSLAYVNFVSNAIDPTNNTKVMGGVSNNTFSPLTNYTREQAMITLKRLYNYSLKNTLKTYNAEQISDMISDNVYYIEIYDSNNYLLKTGSGFLLDNKGHVVTNYHVTVDGSYAKVITNDKKAYITSTIVDVDKDNDIAVLQINELAGGTCYIGNSDLIKNGQKIFTIGSPIGLDNTMSDGIISNKNRSVDGYAVPLIQISAPISSGSSGGALINEYAQIIGITCACFTEGQNLNLAIPINVVKRLSLNNSYTMSMYTSALNPPDNVFTYPLSNTEIAINWDYVENADYYYVYYCSEYDINNDYMYYFGDENGEKTKVSWRYDYSARLYDVNPYVTYYFWITSVKNGVESLYSDVNSFNIAEYYGMPYAPTDVKARAISSTEFEIGWSPVSDADYYYVYYATEYGFNNNEIYYFETEDGSPRPLYYIDEYSAQLYGVNPGDTYYFWVTAVKNGVESVYSTYTIATTPF